MRTVRLCQRLSPFASKTLLACFLVVVVALISGCSTATVPKPVEIGLTDTCTFCKQRIEEKKYAAEFLTKDGFARKFDDISCMIQHAKKVKSANIAEFFVMDYDAAQADPSQSSWLNANQAQFVQGEQIKTPMNGGVVAFKDKARADSVAASFQAKVVGFTDLMK
jgi:copper chaperone NosL